MQLGKIHLSIYQELAYLLSHQERNKLQEKIINRIKNALEILCVSNRAFYCQESVDNDPVTRRYADDGEFYNHHYKQLMFDLHPKLLENFSLGTFSPSLNQLGNYFKSKTAFANLDMNHFKKYVSQRMIFLINARFFSTHSGVINWHRLQWEFDVLTKKLGPLIGHLVHRELRNFGRYPDFYFYFDQTKALQAWNYWNHHNIAVPFNGIIPKGEVGINPAYADMKYKIFTGKILNEDGIFYVEPAKELDIEIVPRLINPRHTFMRNKYYV